MRVAVSARAKQQRRKVIAEARGPRAHNQLGKIRRHRAEQGFGELFGFRRRDTNEVRGPIVVKLGPALEEELSGREVAGVVSCREPWGTSGSTEIWRELAETIEAKVLLIPPLSEVGATRNPRLCRTFARRPMPTDQSDR